MTQLQVCTWERVRAQRGHFANARGDNFRGESLDTSD